MNNDWFFEKFALIADAPGAVEKMRGLVLDLAVTGKLVDQAKHDQHASVILESALTERAAFEADRTIKARSSAPVRSEDEPYKLPSNWIWARLAQIGYELGQKIPDKRFTYIDVGGIDAKKGQISDQLEVLEFENAPSRARKKVALGTVIYSTVRPYLRNIAIVTDQFDPEPIASTAFGILHPFPGINNRYVFYWLRSGPFTEYVEKCMKGMAYPAINDEKFYSGYIPLPPLAEQKRIVAKVDELMGLCDALEAQQKERELRKSVLVRSSLSRFAESPTPENLGYLFHKSYDIPPSELRKSILTLAVQGKLVPQDPNDEPAEVLISRVVSEKTRLVRSKEIKNEHPMEPITSGEVFSIPKTWVWCRAGALSKPISSGSTPDQNIFHPSEGIPYLKVYNIRNQRVDFDYKPQFITKSYHKEKMKRSTLIPGDVVMNIVGPPLGKVAIIPDSFPEWNCNQAISFFRPVFPELAQWIYTFLKEGSFLRNIQLIGTAGQDNISVTKCKFIPIAIPPILEQHRIVAKVDQLMALVDELERQQESSRENATKLLDAIVQEMTSGDRGIAATLES
jgi:type I restriction enzyme S subunit